MITCDKKPLTIITKRSILDVAVALDLPLGIMNNSLQKQSPEVFCKKGVLKKFAKFTGKHLYQSIFFNKVY